MKEKISQFLSEIVEEVSAEEFLSIMEVPPEEAVKQARLALTELTQQVLCDGCGLLGVECPEEM